MKAIKTFFITLAIVLTLGGIGLFIISKAKEKGQETDITLEQADYEQNP